MAPGPVSPGPWPPGFSRIPPDAWVEQPPETLALKYDTVQDHGWYRNLDRTVDDLAAALGPGDILLDYSGGTGILAERLLHALPDLASGILIVDASPKFLRVALEKLGGDERVAFRLIRYLKEERRLETVQEVVGEPLLRRGVDAVASTNAIHLYYDLDDTLRSWHDLLVPGGRAFVQSGNIGVAEVPEGCWIIDRDRRRDQRRCSRARAGGRALRRLPRRALRPRSGSLPTRSCAGSSSCRCGRSSTTWRRSSAPASSSAR